MSTSPLVAPRLAWARAKYLVFGFIGLMVAYVLHHNEHFRIDAKDPEWSHIQSFRWWLLPHGLMGACALLLGPMQFSDRLRQRFTKFHRVVGRFYVAGVFVAAPLGFYIQHFEERMGGARSFSVAAGVDAILWMLTTGIAFVFILKGKVQQHRQWMTRSFAVASVFLEVRVVLGVTGLEKVGGGAFDETVVWACVAFSLLFADIALRGRSFVVPAQPPPRFHPQRWCAKLVSLEKALPSSAPYPSRRTFRGRPPRRAPDGPLFDTRRLVTLPWIGRTPTTAFSYIGISTHAPPPDSHCSDFIALPATPGRGSRMARRPRVPPSHSPRTHSRSYP